MLLALLSLSLATSPLGRYREVRWAVDDGLPQSSITAIAQSPDGWLDLGTFGGFARYDGHRFEAMDAASLSQWNSIRITALTVDAAGTRWLGFQDGDVLALEPDGRTRSVPRFAPLQGGAIWSIATAGDVVWVGGATGAARFDGTWEALPVGATSAVVTDDAGAWLGTDAGLLRVEGEAIRAIATPIVPVRALERADDALLVGGDAGVVRVVDGRAQWLEHAPTHALVRAADGTVFAAGDAWLRVVGEPERVELPAPVRDLFVDREQGLWVGTAGDGLHRFVREDWDVRWAGGDVLPVLERSDGTVLLGSGSAPGGLIALAPDGSMRSIAGGTVRALAHGADGVYVGADTLLLRLDPDDHTEFVIDLEHDVQVILAREREGTRELVVGTNSGGAFVVRDGVATPLDVGLTRIVAIAAGHGGALWFGGHDALTRLHRGVLTRWDHRDGLPIGEIRSLRVDDDDTVWIGSYGGGLGVLREGTLHRLTRADGLAEDVVSAILDDGRGGLWLHGNRGLARVSRAELEARLVDPSQRLRARRWATPEGNGGGQPAGIITRGGVLLLPTIAGLLRLDPRAIADTPPASPVQLLHANVDGSPLPRGDEAVLVPGPGRLEVAFTSPILRHPELAMFEYRLHRDGESEPPWQVAGPERTLTWAALPPGRHVLELRASAEDGRWSTPTVLAFTLPPAWHQRWPLQLAAVAAALAAVAAGVAARARWLRAHVRTLRAEVASRAAVETALRDREAHYRRVFDGGSDALFVLDADGRVEQANPAAARLLGRDPVGDAFDRLFEPAREPAGPQAVIGASAPTFASLLRTRFDDDRQLARAVDVSAQVAAEARERQLAERLSQSERLEAVGRLAGGIAHDFNNLLTAVRGVADALQEQLPAEGPDAAAVGTLQACVDRGATLTRQLLAFARRQPLTPQSFDAATLVRELQGMIGALLRRDVRVTLSLPALAAGVRADPTQLELALVNLVLNAQEAMPSGGEITIEVVVLDDGAARARVPALPQGAARWVLLSVRDHGVGIAADALAKVVEPFYTSRSNGTGLGLPSVLGFAAQSGGTLQLDSELGRGTVATIALPEVAPVHAVPSTPRRARPADEPVEVVVCDDDELVRESLLLSLRRGGYAPRGFADPSAVLAAIEQGLRPDVLVSDVMMPGCSGPELAQRVLAQHPACAVVFVSGFLEHDEASALPGRLLVKPVRARELVAAVAAAATLPQA
ncbi:MAG: response regulator [Nannocystaceae bacterium]|nr:response regulator [Nannocystaceae bacterium]